MNPEKRMTKRQMKEDRLVSTTFKATEYIQKNKTPFIVGGIAILAIFTLVIFIRSNASSKKDEAASILSRAELMGGTGQMDQYRADLQLLADNYSSTPTGKIAALRLANDFFNSKQYDNAERYFDKILDRYSDDKMLAASASSGKAACQEIKGNFLEAAKLYMQAAEYKSGDIWTPSYLLKAGQNYLKAGDRNAAERAFTEIEKSYPNSSESTSAKREIAGLKY